MIAENVVKKWEMEMTHITGRDIWRKKQQRTRASTYNWMMRNISKELYDAQYETFESSHELFRGAFSKGFAWELLEVYSGPPKVAFSWRHWGIFSVEYKGTKGADQKNGFTVATVNSNLKISNWTGTHQV